MTNVEAFSRFKALGGVYNYDDYPPCFIAPILPAGSPEGKELAAILSECPDFETFEAWLALEPYYESGEFTRDGMPPVMTAKDQMKYMAQVAAGETPDWEK